MFRRLRDGIQRPFQAKREVRREQLGRNASQGAPQPNVLGRSTDEPLHSISESPACPVNEVRVEIDTDRNSDDGKCDDEKSETSAAVSQSTTAGTASNVGGSLDGDAILAPKALFQDPTDSIDDDELERDYEVKVRQRLLAIMKKAGALDDDETPGHLAPPLDHHQLLARIHESRREESSTWTTAPSHETHDAEDHNKVSHLWNSTGTKHAVGSAGGGSLCSGGRRKATDTCHEVDALDLKNNIGIPTSEISISINEPEKEESDTCAAEVSPAMLLAPAVDNIAWEQPIESREQGLPTEIRGPRGKAKASPKRKV
eukprot:gnl/MRDRNA2_/MRDRNA2_34627_c0_seq1.p1 gnl/MRDRNA2_/MRDRNA2_34627_c0~~gnl/MRDRNA2_/MRDRNA2_34627_c0_seq1.p1  ORF type:complete len:315 (+),score=68.38 gnl/MRDRNA2_/MRDRNA2_34627_c0_seq1:73-1017(+)